MTSKKPKAVATKQPGKPSAKAAKSRAPKTRTAAPQVATIPEGLQPNWDKELTVRQSLFVLEYLKSGNATQSAIKAGYSEKVAAQTGARLLINVKVSGAIAQAQAARKRRLQIEADEVVQWFYDVAKADIRELMTSRRVCCRHCHGIESEYQYTPAEYKRAKAKHEQRREGILAASERDIGEFPEYVGAWYNIRKPINPECPECFGEGVFHVVLKDVDQATGPAAMLFAGIKEGRDGIEMKVHDQKDAMDKVARAIGVYGKAGDLADTAPVTAEALDKLFGDAMKQARARQDEVNAQRKAEGRGGD